MERLPRQVQQLGGYQRSALICYGLIILLFVCYCLALGLTWHYNHKGSINNESLIVPWWRDFRNPTDYVIKIGLNTTEYINTTTTLIRSV
jgi:hypothetical protein